MFTAFFNWLDTSYAFRGWIMPGLLVIFAPQMCFLWTVLGQGEYDGSVIRMYNEFDLNYIWNKYAVTPELVPEILRIVFSFLAIEVTMLALLPGSLYKGPPSSKGTEPEYRLNGVLAYILSMSMVLVGQFYGIYRFTRIYDIYPQLCMFMNIVGMIFVVLLLVKGKFMPSTPDCEFTGNPVWDYFWGVELYPSIFGLSLKQIVNCRFGMMLWPMMTLICLLKQLEETGSVSNSMWVSFIIQQVYLFKFFYWEGGYFKSIDIMHDKFGFMICYGCLAYLPSLYTLPSQFLVRHPVQMPMPIAAAVLVLGVGAVWANYNADEQRQTTRDMNGKNIIWGKKPKLIVAKYTTEDGKTRENLLLVSGWWGVARHWNYIPELTLALAWSLPGGNYLTPYFYVLFLTILLSDRARRDEKRCRNKYKKYWNAYCKAVPWTMIPGIY